MLDYEIGLKNSWNVVKDNLVTFIVGLLIAAVGSILIVTIAPLAYGFTSMAVKGARGEQIEISDVFVGFNKDDFIRSWTFMLIYIVIAAILGQIASILSTIVGILFMFTMPLLVIKGYSGIEGITESIEIIKKVPVESIIVYVIMLVLNMIGAFLLGIGLLVTVPISTVFLANATFELSGE
ncbi:hypothetical protein [Methanococcoides alaskense]|uniref:Membrane protein n=1 Tax=Methanococcoides alaskense TaxID=325778 RepID=A0AA90U1M4_9EURY|nr:hypothetical protein [Methanococcoides alaskense]MDA0525807.1 hypothetical protein [Methanococcoides alaskense]MDR6223967.1 putative membrane protein [Methanococcoides alaskense]